MHMFMGINRKEYLYNHQSGKDTVFVFPITGLLIENTLTVGKTIFINKNDTSFEKYEILNKHKDWIDDHYSKINTLGIVDISDICDKWRSNCDNNSIALQVLKQSIGIIYLCLYCNSRVDDGRRIVISNIGLHEVDEGLTPYFSSTQIFNGRNISETLFLKVCKNIIKDIEVFNHKVTPFYHSDEEFPLKLLRCLELIYCLQNEIYANERVLKISAFLNFIFLRDINEKIDFPIVQQYLKQLFNFYKIDVYKKLPNDICNKSKLGKLNDELTKIHNKIRNNFSHGKIDIYNEFTVIPAIDYFIFNIVLMELIMLLLFNKDFTMLKTSKELYEKIQDIILNFKNVKQIENSP